MAHKQEQEPAREEVTEVAPDVLRMQLPIRLPGLGHVNCFAILDRDGAALVDPGLPGPATWRALQDRLQRAGIPVKHVHTVFVTHSHPDHFGGAARVAKESGARIIAHSRFSFGPPRERTPEADVEASVDDLASQEAEDASLEAQESDPPPPQDGRTPWGGERPRPPLRTRLRWRLMQLLGAASIVPRISHPVEHGEVVELAGREWFVSHTPGHTTDHVCLHDPEHGTFLAGDHVLPSITPHISGLGGNPDPLASFFYSLDRVAEIQGVKQVLPAHGHPFSNLPERCDAIKRHHYERLDRVKAISAELGPASVGAISRRLFRQRSWGPMAESETYAHLEHLRIAGQAERRRELGRFLYVAG